MWHIRNMISPQWLLYEMGEGVDLFIRKNISDSGSLFLSLIKSHRFSAHCILKIYFHPFISRLKDENCLMWLSLLLSMRVWRLHLDHQHGVLESGPKNRLHLSCPCRPPFLVLCSVWVALGKTGPFSFFTDQRLVPNISLPRNSIALGHGMLVHCAPQFVFSSVLSWDIASETFS